MDSWTVLLVDDSKMFREITTQFLSYYPYLHIIGEAEDAISGYQKAMVLRPDIILLDWEMPGKMGAEIVPELQVTLPEAKVIVLTLMNNRMYRRHALAMGADAFVPKSQLVSDLIPAIHQAMVPDSSQSEM